MSEYYERPPIQGSMPPYGYGSSWGAMRRRYPIETKPFFLTSEFFALIGTIIGAAITTAVVDAMTALEGMSIIAGLVCVYMLSRGIAKAGTHSMAPDPREHLMFPGMADRERTPVRHGDGG
jgi:hypothetical protein